MVVSGATWFALAGAVPHPEATVLADVARRELILNHVMPEIHLRRLEASLIDVHVHDYGDDKAPPHVVYRALGSSRAARADDLF